MGCDDYYDPPRRKAHEIYPQKGKAEEDLVDALHDCGIFSYAGGASALVRILDRYLTARFGDSPPEPKADDNDG